MKRSVLLILLAGCLYGFLAPTVLVAQGWEYLAPGGQARRFETAIATPDGGMIAGGQGVALAGRILRFDDRGAIRWERAVPEGWVYDILPYGNDYLAIGSQYVNSIPRAFSLRFSATGERLSYREFEFPELELWTPERAYLAADSTLVILGVQRLPEDANSDNRAILTRWPIAENPVITFLEPDLDIRTVRPTPDGGYLLGGQVTITDGQTSSQARLLSVDSLGNTRWSVNAGVNELEVRFGGIVLPGDGTALAVSNYPFGTTPLFLTRFDLATGMVLDRDSIVTGNRFIPIGAIPDGDDGLIVAGRADLIPGVAGTRYGLVRIDTTGQLRWSRHYGYPNFSALPTRVVPNALGGATIVGRSTLEDRGYIVHADAAGVSRSNLVTGRVTAFEANCATPHTAGVLAEWWVRAWSPASGDTLYGLSDAEGRFAIPLDSGDYRLELLSPNAYWTTCAAGYDFSLGANFDTVTLDPGASPVYDCPLPVVDIGSPLLRRCYPSNYFVSYRNEGTRPAPNALLEVTLDSLFTVSGSMPSWTLRSGDTLWYALGELPVGQSGQIRITGSVDCETSIAGQTHCSEARIFPDSLCTPPGVNWDGSSLEVVGTCTGDSVRFEIRNVGADMTQTSQYVITQDVIIHKGGYFQLLSGRSIFITAEATGATYRLTAEQAPGHPGSSLPSAVVEGCVEPGGDLLTLGLIPGFALDEGDPFVAIDCQANRSSWDPNDIAVAPAGIGPQQLIDPEIPLEYRIRFQNTGNDTAFRVVILDTLPASLELGTVRPGASSHPYTLTTDPGGALRFTFDPIQLPDSATDPLGSQGFVQFRVEQSPTVRPGDRIDNRATIYFDFNAGVTTNTAGVRLRRPQRYDFTEDTLCVLGIALPERAVQIDTIALVEYDSLRISGSTRLPAWHIYLDTVLQQGDSLWGGPIATAGSYIDSLRTELGCDSLIQYDVLLPARFPKAAAIHLAAYPNPTRTHWWIGYQLPVTAPVRIELSDPAGRRLWQRSDSELANAGGHLIRLDALRLPPGVYFLRLRAGPHRALLRLVRI